MKNNSDKRARNIFLSAAISVILLLPLFLSPVCGGEPAKTGEAKNARNIDDPWFAKDKFKHLAGSMLLAGMAYAAADTNLRKESDAIIAGFSIPFSLGLLKEYKDLKAGKFWSNRDLVWDAIGAGIVVFTASQMD